MTSDSDSALPICFNTQHFVPDLFPKLKFVTMCNKRVVGARQNCLDCLDFANRRQKLVAGLDTGNLKMMVIFSHRLYM